MPGTWSVAAVLDRSPSLIEGLREMVGRMDEMPLNQPNEPWYIPLMENGANINLLYAKGSNLISDAAYEERATMFGRSLNRDNRTDAELLKEALETANKADVIVAALGESSEMSGESSSRTDLNLPDVQQTLLKELGKISCKYFSCDLKCALHIFIPKGISCRISYLQQIHFII